MKRLKVLIVFCLIIVFRVFAAIAYPYLENEFHFAMLRFLPCTYPLMSRGDNVAVIRVRPVLNEYNEPVKNPITQEIKLDFNIVLDPSKVEIRGGKIYEK